MRSTLFYAGYYPSDGLSDVQAISFQLLESHCRNLDIHFEAIFASDNPEGGFESIRQAKVRKNLGYDFGSWAELIGQRNFDNAERLIFMNSSFIGPMFSAKKFFDTFIKSDFDFLALTESLQIKSHFQSYFWAVTGKVANDTKFREFLNRQLTHNNRESAIREKELELKELIESLSYKAGAVFPAATLCPSGGNPSLEGAYKMIRAGVPFIKSNLHGFGDGLKLIELTTTYRKDELQEELISRMALRLTKQD